MNPEEHLEVLLKKQQVKETLSLLETLTPKERKDLAPHIKKLYKAYDQFVQEGNTYRNKMTEAQRTILSYAAFVCFNQSEFVKSTGSWMISREYLDKVLPWYCPTWFSGYMNSFKDQEWLPYQLDYLYLIELAQKGYLEPHPHLVARLLVPVIYENKDRKNYFVPQKLEQYEITLEEHIWYLFEYETTIHASDRYIRFEDKKAEEDRNWITLLQQYAQTGKIDRERLLKEALLASNRNFNKVLSGWFAALFQALQPSDAELLELQPELFLLFSSPHSKVVNTALQGAKQIVHDPAFDRTSFLDLTPLLLASGTKSVVATALQQLEKLGKQVKELQTPIALLAAQALVHKEESLQKKAAQLICAFGGDEEELKQAVSVYEPIMFSAAKGLLSSYLEVPSNDDAPSSFEQAHAERSPVLEETTSMTPVTDLDRLLFLLSQAFDNNEPYHFDLVLDALVRLQKDVNEEAVAKLEPSFQRALKLFFGDWRSHIGQLDSMLAILFLEFGQLLMRRYPNDTASLRGLYEGFMLKNEQNKRAWEEHGNHVQFMGDWPSIKEREIYKPHRKLLEAVLTKLLSGDTSPLLSTPTHLPCWIDPKVLVQRLAQYQRQKREYDKTDLQVALSRCWLWDTGEAMALAEKELKGEEKRLLRFLLDRPERPEGPFQMEWAWMVAALSKSPGEVFPELEGLSYSQKPRARYTGQYPWSTVVEDYKTTEYKWENGNTRTFQVPATRKVLRLDLSVQKEETKKEGGFKKWISKFTGVGNSKAEAPAESLIYDHLHISSTYLSVEDRDIRRILFLIPNNPEPLLALAIHKCLEHSQFWSETDKRMVIELLRGLHELDRPLGETGHLFIATALVCSDKTAASYAAEIWIQGVPSGNIDSASIGRVIGLHQQVEFIPLKRLNDLVVSRLLGISSLHNKALEEMMGSLLKHLPAKPVKHLKKAIQIYLELVALNGSIVKDQSIMKQLDRWGIKYNSPATVL